MISEYERAQIGECTRLGHCAAREPARSPCCRGPPNGYLYIRKSELADAFLAVDETLAQVVREIFAATPQKASRSARRDAG